jgi:hypothetical protein
MTLYLHIHKYRYASLVKYKFRCQKCNRENSIVPQANSPRVHCSFCGISSARKNIDIYVDTSRRYRDLAEGQERYPVYFFGSDEAYEAVRKEYEVYITESVTTPCIRLDYEAEGGASECT